MILFFTPVSLELKNVFTISGHSRNATPCVLISIGHDGFEGFGEASLPPYLGENQDSVIKFLSKINLNQFDDPLDIQNILGYVDAIGPENNAAKAAVDIALHDLAGKITASSVWKMFGLSPVQKSTSITIGIDNLEKIKERVKEFSQFDILKVKLGTDYDKQIINTIREISDKPIYVDVNQGWKDKAYSAEMIYWLFEKGVVLIEQPMKVEMIDEISYLTEISPIPIIADEAVKRLEDINKIIGVYSGINIKLMKSTGISEGFQMCKAAKDNGLKIMIGCMTETSCAISAAAQLSSLADYIDLDGNLLIRNDPFSGVKATKGFISLTDKPGVGVEKIFQNHASGDIFK